MVKTVNVLLGIFYHNLRKKEREKGRKEGWRRKRDKEWGGEGRAGEGRRANELIDAPHFWTPQPSCRPKRPQGRKK